VAGRADVGVSLGDDLDEMTRRAIDSIGGMDSVVKPGNSVFIKPNAVGWGLGGPDTNHITKGERTKPEIVIAVAEECLKSGASRVVIGEAAQDLDYRFPQQYLLDGQTRLGYHIAELNDVYGPKVLFAGVHSSTPYWVFVPSRTEFGHIGVTSFAAEADVVISIPVLKTHHGCGVTLGIKNFMGITPTCLYGNPRLRFHQCDMGVEQCFLDVVKGVQPKLTVIDASIGAEGEAPGVGPGAGTTVDMKDRIGNWAILAGTDPVAVDCTATRMIGHEPMWVRHLRMAYDQGMGELREDQIRLIGGNLEDLRTEWTPSASYPQ
jgi:uncharacterized protein (DUF362 family)